MVLRRPGSFTDIIDSGVVGGLEILGGGDGGTELVTGVQGVVFCVVEYQCVELGVWGEGGDRVGCEPVAGEPVGGALGVLEAMRGKNFDFRGEFELVYSFKVGSGE